MTRKLAVVIPTLNEAAHLSALLDDLRGQDIDVEVVVVDGGSTDETTDIARSYGVNVIDAPRGRASQMNAGREAVDVGWLLFLHADTRIADRDALRRALDAIGDNECGHFRLRFRGRDWRFRFLEAKTALNRPHTTNGDQGMLVPATLFDEIGGFDASLGFLEDQRFAETARAAGVAWVTLPGDLSTSPRRFDSNSFAQRYFCMAVLMSAYGSGASELFARFPDAYERNLTGLIAAVRDTTSEMSCARMLEVYMSAAKFIRAEAWQLFFMADVALGDELPAGCTPLLDWYDDHLAGIDVPAIDAAIALASYLLLNVVLSPD